MTSASYEGQYTYVDALAASVPEIAALMNQASAGGWDATRFADALQATSWWKNNSSTARQMYALQAQQPAEYNQQYTAAQAHVTQMAAQMGVTLTQDQINQQATADLFQGLDDATLQTNIAANYKSGGDASGQVASTTQQLKTLAASYGIPVTQSWIDNYVQQSLSTGTDVTAAATQSLVTSAKSMYPGLSQQLDSGESVQQIAQPYVAQMSQVLEIPDTTINLTDPTIQKALQGYGTPTANASASAGTAPDSTTPLWQFTQQLKQDPRWQQTDNAKSTAYSLLHGLGQSFGFAS